MHVIRDEALDWYSGALEDLKEANDAFERNRFNWAVFAAHQAVEKALKAAIIVLKKERPPKTHDLIELLRYSNIKLSEDLIDLLGELTPYYVISRYPNVSLKRPWEEIRPNTARKLIDGAKRVIEYVGEITNLRS